MKPELVEKVAEQIGLLASQYGAPYWPRHAARYALALAERAAREGLAAGERMGLYDLVTTPEECVERAAASEGVGAQGEPRQGGGA